MVPCKGGRWKTRYARSAIEEGKMQLCVPLFLPLGLELGSFHLAGTRPCTAPPRNCDRADRRTDANGCNTNASRCEALANGCPNHARGCKARRRNPRLLPHTIATRIPGAGNASCIRRPSASLPPRYEPGFARRWRSAPGMQATMRIAKPQRRKGIYTIT
jgi:hypothetical protein